MGYGNVGRPAKDGDRYPGGKLKPRQEQPPVDPAREPISGATVQRMLSADVRRYREADYGKEATRLWAAGQLSPAELATGLRFAAIYGRFEFYNGLSRSAAAPHYIREYISEGIGTDDGSDRSSGEPEDRETREIAADQAFKSLQDILAPEYRAVLEHLFVDDRHVGYHLPKAKTALAFLAEHFRDEAKGIPKKDRKRKKKQRSATPASPAPAAKPANLNPAKIALRTLLASSSPHLGAEGIEQAWSLYCALKAREDFRRDKAESQ
jgi:hypothetical protein